MKPKSLPKLSTLLRHETRLAVERLSAHPRASRVLSGTVDRVTLASFYSSIHEIVRHASEYLRRAGDEVARSGGNPEVDALLQQKASEEAGHDAWLRNDLEAIGFRALDWPPAVPAARAYHEFHMSTIPVCGELFLGTAWILESLAVECGGVAAANLREHSLIEGIRADSTSGVEFLRSHSEEDVGHIDALADVLDRTILDPRRRDFVALGARFTGTLYPEFFSGEDGS